MDDVDKIIFLTLKSLGWEMENDCIGLREASLSDVAGGLVICLQAIDSNYNLPNSFPQNIAQRYKVATIIADCIKELDYPGEIGYPTIMYPNETELRKIFMFLIDKLPKETPILTEQANDRLSVLHRKAKLKVKLELNRPWIPFHCMNTLRKYKKLDIGPQLIAHIYEDCDRLGILLDQNIEQFASSSLQKILSPNVEIKYESNKKKIMKIPFSLFEHSSKFDAKYDDALFHTEENVSNTEVLPIRTPSDNLYQSLHKKLEHLNIELNEVAHKLELSKGNISKSQTLSKSYTEMISTAEQHLVCLRDLPKIEGDAQDVKNQLQEALQASQMKEKRVEGQWIIHKTPFEIELVTLKEEATSKQGQAEQMRMDITDAQERVKLLLDELNKKKSSIADLQIKLQNSDDGINRSEYTDKIFDIASKVEKQRRETDKVIVDIKQMHKEVNILTGKLSRTFNHVENLIFNKLTVCMDLKEEYRIIIGIHESYGELNDKLYEILNVGRETASVKQQVDAQKKENIENQLKSLQSDLENILKENKLISQKL